MTAPVTTSMATVLADRASTSPDAPFLVWRGFDGERTSWTYAEAERAVASLAGGLTRQGVRVGDRVCLFGDNRPEYLLSLLALLHVGAVAVSVNARSASPELRYFLDKAGCTGILHSDQVAPVVEAARADQWVANWDDGNAATSTVAWSRLASASPIDPIEVDLLAPAGIQFTSGTTSRPKGVVWTQANYAWGAMVSAAHERLEASDRHLTYLPLFHTNAQIYSVMASLWVGAAIILQPRFSATRFWDVAVGERATWSSMIPFAIKALRGQPVPPHQFRRWGTPIIVPSWEKRFGVPFTAWWGMTETVTHGMVSDPERPTKPMGIGYEAPEYSVRVLREDRAPAAVNDTGDLEVRGVPGVSMFLEYLGDPAATRASWTADGWFRTGDRVRRDGEGWVTFVDRASDMLKVAGENVSPSEIERVVSGLSAVDECVVVGLADEMRGEVPVAFVVPALGNDSEMVVRSVLEACRTELASFKVPADVRIVSELPRSTLAKVSRAELKRRAEPLATRQLDAVDAPGG